MTAELKYTLTEDDGTSTVTLKGEYTKFDNFGYISNPTYLSINEGGEVMEWKEGDPEDSELYTMAVFIAEGVWIFDNFVYYGGSSGFADDYTPSGTDQIIGGTFGVIRGLTGNETLSEIFEGNDKPSLGIFFDRYENYEKYGDEVDCYFQPKNLKILSFDGKPYDGATKVTLGLHTVEVSFQLEEGGETLTTTALFNASNLPNVV